MAKVRVPIVGAPGKVALVNPAATVGAQLGVNLLDANGDLLTVDSPGVAAAALVAGKVAFMLTLDIINRIDLNAPNSERFFGNINAFIRKVDLSGVQQVRYLGRVNTASVSANTPVLRLKYFTSFSTTVGDYLQLGASSEVEFSVAATGYLDTGWVDMASGAKVNNIFLAAVGDGGNAAADPAVSNQTVMFR